MKRKSLLMIFIVAMTACQGNANQFGDGTSSDSIDFGAWDSGDSSSLSDITNFSTGTDTNQIDSTDFEIITDMKMADEGDIVKNIVLVQDRIAVGDIVCSPEDDCSFAAKELQRLIFVSSGINIPIIQDRPSRNHIILTTKAVPSFVKYDGFFIESFSNNSLTIFANRGTKGLEMAVFYLAERDLNAVWLYPGANYEVLSKYDSIVIQKTTVKENPEFQLRQIYLSPNENKHPFLFKNKSYPRGDTFGHNMATIYPVSKYGITHPEFYPIINGTRFIPQNDGMNFNWNPVIDAPGAVSAAIETIDEYLNRNPDQQYFSLSTNDGGDVFDDKYNNNPRNSLGWINVSNEYWKWVKEVAEGVHTLHPKVVFGALVYVNVYAPPTDVKLPKYVDLYIATDLFKHGGPEQRAITEAQIQSWQSTTSELAWWDYSIGERLNAVIPRIHSQRTRDYLNYLSSKGIDKYFGEYDETEPHWLTGPKVYLDSKLLWNPSQSVSYNRWTTAAVGEVASISLTKYYEFWSNYWDTKLFNSYIISRYRHSRPYLSFNNFGVINLLHPSDIEVLDSHIQQTLNLVSSPREKAMAEYICEGWNLIRKEIYYLVKSSELSPFTMLHLRDFENGRGSLWGDSVYDQTVGHNSSSSIRTDVSPADISNGRITKNTVFSDANITPRNFFKLEGYVRSTGFNNNDDNICFGTETWRNGTKATVKGSHMFCPKNLLNDSWTYFSGIVRSPQLEVNNSLNLRLQIIAKNAGKVWFDDLKISESPFKNPVALECSGKEWVCDQGHLGYCKESNCKDSGGNWCHDSCVSYSCSNQDTGQ